MESSKGCQVLRLKFERNAFGDGEGGIPINPGIMQNRLELRKFQSKLFMVLLFINTLVPG